MDAVMLLRQGLLYAHLLAFALAIAEIARGDWRLLRQKEDFAALQQTALLVSWALLALWITGLGLVGLETGFDLSVIAGKPKLVTKLVVVIALTGNGVLLHRLAFPLLAGGLADSGTARLVAALGAISTVSWLYAAFLGVGRIVAGAMTLNGFLALYGLALAAGIGCAVLVVAPLLRQRMAPAARRRPMRPSDETLWLADEDIETIPDAPPAEAPTRRAMVRH